MQPDRNDQGLPKKNTPLYKAASRQYREKFLITPRVGNAKTDETGFWRFCHYATWAYSPNISRHPEEDSYHLRKLSGHHPGGIYLMA
jgi:hypothetical protein